MTTAGQSQSELRSMTARQFRERYPEHDRERRRRRMSWPEYRWWELNGLSWWDAVTGAFLRDFSRPSIP